MKELFSILILFAVYVWVTQMREGFKPGETPDKAKEVLTTLNDTVHSNLNISKFKPDYTEIIDELNRTSELRMLQIISAPTGKMNTSEFNKMFEFKRNLSEFKSILNNMS